MKTELIRKKIQQGFTPETARALAAMETLFGENLKLKAKLAALESENLKLKGATSRPAGW